MMVVLDMLSFGDASNFTVLSLLMAASCIAADKLTLPLPDEAADLAHSTEIFGQVNNQIRSLNFNLNEFLKSDEAVISELVLTFVVPFQENATIYATHLENGKKKQFVKLHMNPEEFIVINEKLVTDRIVWKSSGNVIGSYFVRLDALIRRIQCVIFLPLLRPSAVFPSLPALSAPLVETVFSFLQVDDVCHCGATSKALNTCYTADAIWRPKLIQDFPDEERSVEGSSSSSSSSSGGRGAGDSVTATPYETVRAADGSMITRRTVIRRGPPRVSNATWGSSSSSSSTSSSSSSSSSTSSSSSSSSSTTTAPPQAAAAAAAKPTVGGSSTISSTRYYHKYKRRRIEETINRQHEQEMTLALAADEAAAVASARWNFLSPHIPPPQYTIDDDYRGPGVFFPGLLLPSPYGPPTSSLWEPPDVLGGGGGSDRGTHRAWRGIGSGSGTLPLQLPFERGSGGDGGGGGGGGMWW